MRPSKDEYYLNIAKEVSCRSTCFRRRGGAIIVRDDQIVAAGYIGAPRKTKDCLERGFCLREKLNIPHGKQYELCRSVHAEMNAIINSGRAGVSLLGGDMYLYMEDVKKGERVDGFPCFICKKIIINAGLNRFISSLSSGEIFASSISDWAKDWQEKDILDDKHQYGEKTNNN